MSLKIIHDQLRQVTECSIHLGQIQEPKILPCGHSFCLKCIQQCLKVGVIECPLDRTRHKVDNVRKLPTNYAVVDWLDMIGDMKNQQVDVWAEVENVQKNFKQNLHTCDYAVDQLKYCAKIVDDIKLDLVSKHESLEAYFNKAQSSTITDESKDHSMANLLYTCNVMDKMCSKYINPAFEQLNGAISRLQNITQITKMIDIIDFKLKPDKPMHEGKVCQSIITITDTILKEATDLIDNPRKFSERLANEIKQKFGNHLWTVIAGKIDTKLSVMCSEDDYISLSMSDRKIVVYRSNRSSKICDKSDSVIRQFVQAEVHQALRQRSKSDVGDESSLIEEMHVEKRAKLCLTKKFSGEWHVASWDGPNIGGVYCTGAMKNFIEFTANDGRHYCIWQCIDV